MKQDEMIKRIIKDAKSNNFHINYIEMYGDGDRISVIGKNNIGDTISSIMKVTEKHVIFESHDGNILLKMPHSKYRFDCVPGVGWKPEITMTYNSSFSYNDFIEAVDVMALYRDIITGIFDLDKVSIATISTKKRKDSNEEESCVNASVYLKRICGLNVFEWGICLLQMHYHMDNGFVDITSSFHEKPFPHYDRTPEELDFRTFHILLDYGAIKDDLKRRLAQFSKYKNDLLKENIENF